MSCSSVKKCVDIRTQKNCFQSAIASLIHTDTEYHIALLNVHIYHIAQNFDGGKV